MSEPTITIIVDKEGKVRMEAEGYTDGSCVTDTEPLERLYGKVKQRTMKAGGTCAVATTPKVKV